MIEASTAMESDAVAEIAEMDGDLTPADLAALLKVSTQTLAHWRHRGEGPPYYKLTPGRGGRVRYRRADLIRWLEERRGERGDAA